MKLWYLKTGREIIYISALTPVNLFNTFLRKKVDLLDNPVKSTLAFDYAVKRQKRERGPGRLSGTSLAGIFFPTCQIRRPSPTCGGKQTFFNLPFLLYRFAAVRIEARPLAVAKRLSSPLSSPSVLYTALSSKTKATWICFYIDSIWCSNITWCTILHCSYLSGNILLFPWVCWNNWRQPLNSFFFLSIFFSAARETSAIRFTKTKNSRFDTWAVREHILDADQIGQSCCLRRYIWSYCSDCSHYGSSHFCIQAEVKALQTWPEEHIRG